jgi:hypothetical protein
MSAWLCQMGLWRIINKSWKQPKLDLIVATKDANGKVIALTAEKHKVNAKIKLGHGVSLKCCVLAKEKATGDIYAHLSPSQHTLIHPYEEDPATMWGKLLKIYSQQIPGMCFGTYNTIFSIVQQPDELLQAVACRASGALVSAGALVTMYFVFCFRDHVLSHTVYKPGGVTETSHCCLSSYHDLQSIPASQIYLLKRKSKAFDAFKLFKAMVEKQYSAVIRFFHEDKGGKYIGHKWDVLCDEHSI